MAAKPESINAANDRHGLSAAAKRDAKRATTRARRRADRLDPESAGDRYTEGYAD